jgi:hypothetical protein
MSLRPANRPLDRDLYRLEIDIGPWDDILMDLADRIFRPFWSQPMSLYVNG